MVTGPTQAWGRAVTPCARGGGTRRSPHTRSRQGNRAAEHGWTCSSLIRRRSPVRSGVPRLRAVKRPPGAHNPREPGAVPGPATIVRTVAPPRRRAARSGPGALAHQEEHLSCTEEAVGSSPTGSTPAGSDHPGAQGGRHRPAMPRWWNGQHASPSRRRSPVRSRYGVRPPPAPTRRRCAGRRGGTVDTPGPNPGAPSRAWGCKSPRRHRASRPGGPPAFVPPSPYPTETRGFGGDPKSLAQALSGECDRRRK